MSYIQLVALLWMSYRNLDHSSLHPLKCHSEACLPLAFLLWWPVRRPGLNSGMEELRARFSVDSDSHCSPGLLVYSTPRMSLAQGKKLRLWGQRLRWEAQVYHWLSGKGVSKLSIHLVCMCYWKVQEGNTFFFLGSVPMGQVRFNRTDANGRIFIHLSATL